MTLRTSAAHAMTRRDLLTFVAAAGLAPGLVGASAPALAQRPPWQPSSSLAYAVSVGTGEVGRLEIAFHTEGARLVAEMAIDVDVRLAFISAWTYHHRSVETWEGDRLVSFSSTSDDDGRPHSLEGHAVADGFQLTSTRDGQPYLSELAPPDTAPGAYWRRDILERPMLFDPQSGALHPQMILGTRRETVQAAGRPIRAIAYNIQAKERGWVWYEDTGRWLAAEFERGGYVIRQTLLG